jgi:hypothetical protein
MAKLTPIERAIKGEPEDRRRRWEHRKQEAGFKRVNMYVPAQYVPIIKELKAQLCDGSDGQFEDLRQFVACTYEAMLVDPSCDDTDREVARRALRELAAVPAPSEAREEAAPSSDQGNRR